MGHVSTAPENTHSFPHPRAPINEMFEDTVGDDQVKSTVAKRKCFRKGKRERIRQKGNIFGINGRDGRESLPQKRQLESIATSKLKNG